MIGTARSTVRYASQRGEDPIREPLRTLAGERPRYGYRRRGVLLRCSKIDELPQLWNVLLGDMSLVGPRPEVPQYADSLQGEQRRVLSVRPGITCPATLAFRSEEEILASVPDTKRYNDEVIYPEKIRMNLEYIDRLTFMSVLRCILATVLPQYCETEEYRWSPR